MEGVLIMHGSLDRSISPYKSHARTPTRSQPFVWRSYDHNSLPSARFHTRGILKAPPHRPFLSHSYPPYTHRQQPPLLPLPAANPRRSAAAPSRVNKRPNNGSKKPKSPKKEERNNSSPKKSLTPPGPNPNQLPKVLPLIASGTNYTNSSNNTNSLRSIKAAEDDNPADIFSGSAAFSTSPPPSSLPLPTFSLRPKLGCNAEAAAGIDTGATDDLRRLLRLR